MFTTLILSHFQKTNTADFRKAEVLELWPKIALLNKYKVGPWTLPLPLQFWYRKAGQLMKLNNYHYGVAPPTWILVDLPCYGVMEGD